MLNAVTVFTDKFLVHLKLHIDVIPTIATYDHIHQTCLTETCLNPTLPEAESRHIIVSAMLKYTHLKGINFTVMSSCAHTNSNLIITLKDAFGHNPHLSEVRVTILGVFMFNVLIFGQLLLLSQVLSLGRV